MAEPKDMWQCQTANCGYIYNPDKGDRKGKIPPGVKFEDLPEDWKCPVCGGRKAPFQKPCITKGGRIIGPLLLLHFLKPRYK